MPRRVHPEDWLPQGVPSLEPAADNAVRSAVNTLVVAGPGAGKTELLAQRACYLLQTGLCRRPQKILAISYKRDAARNLADRVELRCGEELSRSFHSQTFDAFAKGLFDRFGQALPVEWRPRRDYTLDVRENVIQKRFRDRLAQIPDEFGGLTQREAAQIDEETAYKRAFVGRRIVSFPEKPISLEEKAALATWRYLLHGGNGSTVNLHMVGRLAALVLETNPTILEALRATYAYVFLDEFQDTTSIHYDLLLTAFHGSSTTLTAVGDAKQSIMRWALALPGIFDRFVKDFGAKVERPILNHRSAPKLVAILSALASQIEPGGKAPKAVDDGKTGDGECRVLLFDTDAEEGAALAKLLKQWTQVDGVPPRDICVLTRQQPDKYCKELLAALNEAGVPARIESELQDLLAEPVTTTFLDFVKLATREQAPDSWERLSSLLLAIKGGDAEYHGRQVATRLGSAVRAVAKTIATSASDEAGVTLVLDQVIEAVSRSGLVGYYPQYEQGTYLDDQIALIIKHFAAHLDGHSWSDVVSRFEGEHAIPIMTVHKSKGLEYHTVVFVGLEDWAFRSFERWQDDEAACTFFVAFSRAKKRVLFTFAHERDGRAQSFTKVKPMYDLLRAAGAAVPRLSS